VPKHPQKKRPVQIDRALVSSPDFFFSLYFRFLVVVIWQACELPPNQRNRIAAS